MQIGVCLRCNCKIENCAFGVTKHEHAARCLLTDTHLGPPESVGLVHNEAICVHLSVGARAYRG